MNKWKWLYPGLEIKRWITLIVLGFILIGSGLALMTELHIVDLMEKIIYGIDELILVEFRYIYWIFSIFILILGIGIALYSLNKIEENVNEEVSSEEELVDILYEKKQLEKGPKIVALGGGTGLSNLLRGFKKYTSNITAIVTVADDGGSSGKLREELNILPPGDIRNCLVALADIEPLMKELMQHRFYKKGDLEGHSFGNLFIASMTEVVGDFEQAVRESSKVLAIKGEVLPATNQNVQIGAIYKDNTKIMGESDIPENEKKIKKVFLKPADCKPTDNALKAIKEADIITIGPGSLFTSILPNLLIDEIVDQINKSQAKKVYICNTMTQPGETTGYTAGDHLQTIYDHINSEIFDYILINKEKGSPELIHKYANEGAYPVKIDENKLKKKNIKILKENLLSGERYLRHDPVKTTKRILKLAK